MFNFKDVVSDILLEQGPTDLNSEEVYVKLIARANDDIKNPGTILAATGKDLVNNYFALKGLDWSNKQYYSGKTQKRNLDSVTAKYVDIGQKVYTDAGIKEPLTEANFNLLQDKQDVLSLINKFITTPIASYQCYDPILKNITEADDLAEIAIATFNNDTIFGAVYKMLQQRAGKIKAVINKNTLKSMLLYPAQYASGKAAIPEPFEKTLVDSSLYNDRILAIGVAAIEYYKYLVNQKLLSGKQPVTDSLNNFNKFINNILNEANSGDWATSALQSTQQNVQTTQQRQQNNVGKGQSAKYAQTDLLKINKFNLFDPSTWKRDSVFEKLYLADYTTFLTDGVSQKIPNNTPEKSTIYNISTISQDRSAQAQELIKALQGIAQFKRTKQTLMQKVGQRLQSLGSAASNIAAFAGAKLYGN